jgi:hypothetical protein
MVRFAVRPSMPVSLPQVFSLLKHYIYAHHSYTIFPGMPEFGPGFIMSELFVSGHIVDLILGLVVLEAMAVTLYHRNTGLGVAPADLLSNLLSGVFLMLALRVALVQASWTWTALLLFAALLAHLADLLRRWKRQSVNVR